jgi:hypothetical protein
MTGRTGITPNTPTNDGLDRRTKRRCGVHAEPILCATELGREMAARFSATKQKPSCRCYVGLGIAAIARKHLSEPKLASRAALMRMPVVTRVDAISALDLVAELEGNAELTDHLLTALRAFLQID